MRWLTKGLLLGCLVGCGGDLDHAPDWTHSPVVARRTRGAVTELSSGWLLTVRSLSAHVDNDPRAVVFALGERDVTVTRRAAGVAHTRSEDDLVTVEAGGRTEAYWLASPRGVEELVVAEAGASTLRYDVSLPVGWDLRSPRGRDDALEIVDLGGAARLRMLAARAWEPDGTAHPLTVAIEGDGFVIQLPDTGGPLLVDPEWIDTGDAQYARVCGALTVLNDGTVLLSGSAQAELSPDSPVELSAEIYDPQAPEAPFRLVGDMTTPRCLHTATLLADGRVLLVGGNPSGAVEVYDPSTESFTEIATDTPRQLHTATRLRDGRVLIVGGVPYFADPVEGFLTDPFRLEATPTARVFDPARDELTFTAPLPSPLGSHRATLLPDGSVVVSGGFASEQDVSDALFRFDPEVSLWSQIGSLGEPRHGHTALYMPDRGSILIAGGWPMQLDGDPTNPLLFVSPGSGDATPPPNPPPLAPESLGNMASALLPTGEALLIGGAQVASAPVPIPFGVTYDGDVLTGSAEIAASQSTVLPGGHALAMTADGDVSRLLPDLPQPVPTTIPTAVFETLEIVPLITGDLLLAGMEVGVFSPSGGAAHPLPIPTGRIQAVATLMDGGVLLLGDNGVYLLNPVDESWELVADSLPSTMEGLEATLVPDGSVILTGPSDIVRFDPETHTFTPVSSATERTLHFATLAADGNVWIAGGCNNGCPIEIFDPRSNTVEPFEPDVDVSQAAGTVLLDGRLLLATSSGAATNGLEVIEVNARTREPLNVFASPIATPTDYESVLLPSGRVLFVGREGMFVLDAEAPAIAEIDTTLLAEVTAALLPDGGVLIVERFSTMTEVLGAVWYEHAVPDASWRPLLDTATRRPAFGDTISLTGSGLLGVAEPTDRPGSGKSNHPVAIFMPFGGTPTVGGFHDWTDDSVSWTVPELRQAGPGLLFAAVAGQLGGTWMSPEPAGVGAPCTSASACASGVCLDGFCCEAQCGPCEACAAALSVDGVDGECHPALAGTDEHDDCVEDDVISCGQTGLCDGTGQCALYPDGTKCDERQVCIEQACSERCFSNLHCPEGMLCSADGACQAPLSESEPLGCTPCAASSPPRDHDAWWWLAALALYLGRRRS